MFVELISMLVKMQQIFQTESFNLFLFSIFLIFDGSKMGKNKTLNMQPCS